MSVDQLFICTWTPGDKNNLRVARERMILTFNVSLPFFSPSRIKISCISIFHSPWHKQAIAMLSSCCLFVIAVRGLIKTFWRRGGDFHLIAKTIRIRFSTPARAVVRRFSWHHVLLIRIRNALAKKRIIECRSEQIYFAPIIEPTSFCYFERNLLKLSRVGSFFDKRGKYSRWNILDVLLHHTEPSESS